MDNLTLRQWYAGQALHGLMANSDWLRAEDARINGSGQRLRDTVAKVCFEAADALIEQEAK